MRLASSFLIGLVFGCGIVLSGMDDPAKVLNFLDFAAIFSGAPAPYGGWDPSLGFVMGAALLVTAVGYRLVFAAGRPLLAARFLVPTRRDIDLPLVGGAAVFGVGWGIAGFCPGAAVPALGLGRIEPVIFVAAMLAGIALVRFWRGRAAAPVRASRPVL